MTTFKPLAFAAFTAALLCWIAPTRADLTGVFDLTWDGPETSSVEECVADGFCFQYVIRGGLQLDLDPQSPRLINVNSDILLPPGGVPGSPAAISPILWANFDQLVGEYVEPVNEGDVSIVFTPATIGGVIRAYELQVDLTDNGHSLSLLGGIEQEAASPLEPDVRFSVSGRLLSGDESIAITPEPASLLLVLAGVAGLGAVTSRRGR